MLDPWGIQQTDQTDITSSWDSWLDGVRTRLTSWHMAIHHMPMLPLHVGWCLPLPVPSSNIALPTQKLMSYPTLKLTTHMLPDPKTQQKTHNPQQTVFMGLISDRKLADRTLGQTVFVARCDIPQAPMLKSPGGRCNGKRG